VGSNLRRELPMLAHRVRKAALRGARISFINPARFEYFFPVAQQLQSSPSAQVADLAAVLLVALDGAAAPTTLREQLASVTPNDTHRAIAATLKTGERAIWLGALAARGSRYGELRALARALAQATGAALGELAEGGNAAGACLAGVLPHRGVGGAERARAGRNARQMLEQSLPGYLLLNVEPWADAALPAALDCLGRARCVVAVSAYANEDMKRIAHVLLPAATFAETSGTYVSLEGRWQSQAAAAKPLGSSRPAWKILRVLGNLLELAGFDYQTSDQVRDELKARLAEAVCGGTHAPGSLAVATTEPVIDLPMYQIDPVLRRSGPLARTRDGRAGAQVYGASS
jgi:NADH-quinone oxidoreductase subunit G